MIGQEKLDRINFLAQKKKTEGLTDAEKSEQEILRKEYLEAFKKNFRRQLDNIDIVYKD
ncbi:DUF896 domain-containing protein [Fusibacter tunisiensis]|uniref:UPF0291 protein JOC49_001948 n=1 Tax=Fusibacter tunisiensis TaxID=1008308 RepID=A0ABS2MSM8_9FIRM|nr:uncharacterized protein YnzC (UPF0291/DUF896 family) [Fusibacter tunisiensis]